MSEYPNQPAGQGGWQPPQAAGGWQAPQANGGWQAPSQAGGWPAQPPAYSRGDPYSQPADRYTPLPRPRRRRRRGLIALVSTLVVLIVLLVAADFAAKAYAENTIAGKIKSSGLSNKPSVTIKGFPFLTQVLAHNVHEIDINGNNEAADNGKVTFDFTAKATGVHLNSSFDGATIDQISGEAVFPFSSIGNLISDSLGISGLVTVSADPAAGPDEIQASAPIIGSITGKVVQTSPNVVTLELGSLSGLASLLPIAPSGSQDIKITIPTLPAGLVVRSVSVNGEGIVATASATDTTLTQ